MYHDGADELKSRHECREASFKTKKRKDKI